MSDFDAFRLLCAGWIGGMLTFAAILDAANWIEKRRRKREREQERLG